MMNILRVSLLKSSLTNKCSVKVSHTTANVDSALHFVKRLAVENWTLRRVCIN